MARILVVEDDRSIRNIYVFAFEAEGFQVAMAASGAEALKWVEREHFDVILLDLLMLNMSGIEFLQQADLRTKSPATKVIALTNFTDPATEQRVEALGVVAYLDKSHYDPAQIIQRVKEVLAPPQSAV